ncbi:radical SAM family heme chaperone HemW [Legionella septentrionalis]|uniref:Heme chaperone HemW n=1 Tax=Legionella septentrionalis TaxID=2498109 RepID=A0A3S0VBP8_9GAMM|nr:radical SAM family heme chaperone HemW [Legionella septentrionalis]RUQ90800.1 radical SAM family heme chaperone HemW [Legionella septentrionalis]RUQ95032.1 radical SAM family heme chaperone HemW [Legionella septentrionalis]
MVPLSLYIHIPWCIRKCPYCDFNSHKSPDELPEEQYVNALIADLQEDLLTFENRELKSIFIGGGTPSLFSAKAYETLFTRLKKILPFAENIEITLEANPGTVEQQRFTEYRALGINRLSLGIQSFNAEHLKALGRIHDEKQAHLAIESARKAGFNNLNLDIMHGLPGQSPMQGVHDLRTALSHQPEHLSWYQLTIEPNTVFYKKTPLLPSEDETFAIEEQGLELLHAHGFKRYEISAFCREDKRCKHNMNYWLFGDYYGIGAGAHGKITSAAVKKIYRTRKQRQPRDYLALDKPFLAAQETVGPDNLIFEFMLNTTRLQDPIPHFLFNERTLLHFETLESKLLLAEQKGLLTMDSTHWQVTPLGRRYTNDLQLLFLPDQ